MKWWMVILKHQIINMKVNWDEFKLRCSGIRKALSTKQGSEPLSEIQEKRLKELEAKQSPTDKQKDEITKLILKREKSKNIVLSDTCIDYLMEVYAWKTQGMVSVIKELQEIPQTSKGKKVETDSLLLLCKYDGVIYNTHKERIYNDFLSGEVDSFVGDHIYQAKNVTDIKSAFDYPIFLRKLHDDLEIGQREQVAGYCDITGASEGFIAHCLVDNPEEDILDAKWKLAKKMNVLTDESPEFLMEWEKIERSMRFSHIPERQRVHKIPVELFSEKEKQEIYDRVKFLRDWLWKFDESRQSLG